MMVSDPIEIQVKHGTPAEESMRRMLYRLFDEYNLTGWTYTRTIMVDEADYPHSHPVLTVGIANASDEMMALAELVHEQLHWFEEENRDNRDRAIEETRQHYPTVPVARPEGAGDETSTRLHLLVCHLEHQAMKHLVGPVAARETMIALSRHHYMWVYRTILSEEAKIAAIVSDHDLVPAPLRHVTD
jgi:hypothetical protein